jgi:cysteinyl-tRNA synthetase
LSRADKPRPLAAKLNYRAVDLRFYNTLSRQKEDFTPLHEGEVRMYHCGPTVYKRPHIGNYRAFLFADLLRRWFEANELKVTQVMNLTDVGHLTDDGDAGEDKLQQEAERTKVDPWAIVDEVSKAFFADLNALGVVPAHHYPRATDHIPEMVEMIEVLLEKGHAYRVGDNIYFDVHSFPEYGKLSGNRVEDLEAGARLEINQEKRHPADFALWKSDPHHLMKWKTVFGEDGFPGWHIECSAMARKYLGDQFDLHTGGEDNVFPHHECEIAQSESALNGSFVSLWMHTRFLQVDGGKMSKSLGNVYSIDDLIDRGFHPFDFRFLVQRGHYRTSLNFTWEALKGAAEARKSLQDLWARLAPEMGQLESPSSAVAQAQAEAAAAVAPFAKEFREGLNDDLNTSKAVAALFGLRTAVLGADFPESDRVAAAALLYAADLILGLFPAAEDSADGLSDADIEALVQARTAAKAAKDFAAADDLRDQLTAAGIVVEDTPQGAKWHRS